MDAARGSGGAAACRQSGPPTAVSVSTLAEAWTEYMCEHLLCSRSGSGGTAPSICPDEASINRERHRREAHRIESGADGDAEVLNSLPKLRTVARKFQTGLD
jgi:hypothetical protein